MISGREGLLDAMIRAYGMEKGTVFFYGLATEKALDGNAKRAFGELMHWEEEHMHYIEFLYASIRDQRETMSFSDFKEKVRPKSVEGAIPLEKVKSRLEDITSGNDLEIIEAALEIEREALKLYGRLSEEAEDTNTRVFMGELKGWEKRHLEYLEALKDRVSKKSEGPGQEGD